MTIQWYPGHMAKALRQIDERLKLVDLVLELVDARIPDASINPKLQEILQNKPVIKVLMKSDLADQAISADWIKYYQENDQPAILFSAYEKDSMRTLVELIESEATAINKKRQQKGMKKRATRLLISGIPNVGKSTLINRFAGKKVAQAGNRPGVTRAEQWIKYKNKFELLDTPGVLWPKFEDKKVGKKLALTGAIKDQLLHLDDIALYGIEYLTKYYPGVIAQRYHLSLDDEQSLSAVDLLLTITEKRGFLDDYERGSEAFLHDLRTGKMGRLSFEESGELDEELYD